MLKEIILYGLPNCDTTRAAAKWLTIQSIAFQQVDVKTTPLSTAFLKQCCEALGWQVVLNKKSTTWRQLSPGEQSKVIDEATAIAIIQQYPTLLKRPVVVTPNLTLVGFNEKQFEEKLK
jgi:Spx/MgsR family transcriptional regulator